ncbi:hypothetical protein NL676_039062 [Syzygium grande]|nr:hypothetical protein NL676_039062 [Syzygium grande]
MMLGGSETYCEWCEITLTTTWKFQKVQGLVGPIPEGFDNYFTKRFPRLLIASYEVVSQFCKEEPHFQKYFPSDALRPFGHFRQ